jgi:hypothetical protein
VSYFWGACRSRDALAEGMESQLYVIHTDDV